jgi:glutathione S-transferase
MFRFMRESLEGAIMSETQPVILYGADYSVYARIAHLALHEKGVDHRIEPIDIFKGAPPAYLQLHPFGKIPALEHDGFRLYETGAITRYIDEAFRGPPLQPADPKARARMVQIMGIVDAYAYRPMIWDIVVERTMAPREGRAADEAKIAAAMPMAEKTLAALSDLTSGPYLLGEQLTLADSHLAPIIAYFRLAPEGQQLLAQAPKIARWWELMAERPTVQLTRYPLELKT